MTSTDATQSQSARPAFDPMEMWSKWTQDGIARMQAFYDELAAIEAKAYDRAKVTTEQLAELASESVAYATKLTREWHQMTLEATRRGAEVFKPKA